jgi:hypothetical protein
VTALVEPDVEDRVRAELLRLRHHPFHGFAPRLSRARSPSALPTMFLSPAAMSRRCASRGRCSPGRAPSARRWCSPEGIPCYDDHASSRNRRAVSDPKRRIVPRAPGACNRGGTWRKGGADVVGAAGHAGRESFDRTRSGEDHRPRYRASSSNPSARSSRRCPTGV